MESNQASIAPATISSARVAAAHDGVAELVVRIEYENGGASEVSLDPVAGAALMRSCAAETLDDLTGKSWEKVREALQISYNRYQKATTRATK